MVSLYLVVLFDRQVHGGSGFRSWSLPRPAFATGVDEIKYEVDDPSGDAGRLDSLHLDSAGVPPPDVKLSQFST